MFRKFFLMIISFLMLILSVNAVEITGDLILDDDMILNDQVIIPEGENVVIDLKEKTLEASSDGVRKIINRGTLTIKNGTIVNNNDDAYGIIDNYGSINVQNVVFNDAGCGDGSTLKNRGGNIVVSNTTFNITGIKNGNAGIYSDGTLTISDTTFSSTSTGAYPLIVNSGSAVINNVTVTGSKGGIAVNGGQVLINGGTFTGNTYYGIWITNDGETDVTIKDGKFYGKKYGLYAAVDDGLQDVGDVGIRIMGGYFDGETKSAALVNDDKSDKSWGMDITGGTFTTTVSQYVKTNYREYTGENIFVVAPELTSQILEGECVEKSTTTPLNIIYIDYLGETVNVSNLPISISVEDETIAQVTNSNITGLKNGSTNILIDLHDGRTPQKIKVIVYSVNNKSSNDDLIQTADLNSNLKLLIESILSPTPNINEVDIETREKVKNNILAGNSIDVMLSLNTASNSEINANQYKIDSIKPAGYNLLEAYDIEIKLYANDEYIGNVNKTKNNVEIKIPINNNPSLNSNYNRNYKVVHVHNNITELLDANYLDNNLILSSSKFSFYGVIYKDELKSVLDDVPKTGDFTLYLIIITMSIVFVAGTFWYYKAPIYEKK